MARSPRHGPICVSPAPIRGAQGGLPTSRPAIEQFLVEAATGEPGRPGGLRGSTWQGGRCGRCGASVRETRHEDRRPGPRRARPGPDRPQRRRRSRLLTNPRIATSPRWSRPRRCARSGRRTWGRRSTPPPSTCRSPEASFDAAMAMVTVHQWADTDQGLRELRRVTRGPVVVLTFDGDALDLLWLADYVPELITAERRRYPAIRAHQGGPRRHQHGHSGPGAGRLRERLYRGVLRAARTIPGSRRTAVRSPRGALSSRPPIERGVARLRADP